jgi:uncharacterized protein YqgV (UPF0045/DUF77 family)
MEPIWVRVISSFVAMSALHFVEGSWSAVSQAIHDCHVAVHAKGAPRIATDIRIGTRSEPRSDAVPNEGENERKLRRMQDILGKDRVGSA